MAELLHDYQKAAQQNRWDDLILSHLPLVKHVVGKIVAELPNGVDVENLEAAGVLGLVEAAAKFDPDRNAQFKTFAYFRVRGAIFDEMRRNCPLPQQMITRVTRVKKAYRTLEAPVSVDALMTATGMTRDEVADTIAAIRLTKMISWEQTAQRNGLGLVHEEEAPDADVVRWERVQSLTNAIETLDWRSKIVVTLYYKEDLRLKEISNLLQLSESRISRILSAAMFELGERIRATEGSMESRLYRTNIPTYSRQICK